MIIARSMSPLNPIFYTCTVPVRFSGDIDLVVIMISPIVPIFPRRLLVVPFLQIRKRPSIYCLKSTN